MAACASPLASAGTVKSKLAATSATLAPGCHTSSRQIDGQSCAAAALPPSPAPRAAVTPAPGPAPATTPATPSAPTLAATAPQQHPLCRRSVIRPTLAATSTARSAAFAKKRASRKLQLDSGKRHCAVPASPALPRASPGVVDADADAAARADGSAASPLSLVARSRPCGLWFRNKSATEMNVETSAKLMPAVECVDHTVSRPVAPVVDARLLAPAPDAAQCRSVVASVAPAALDNALRSPARGGVAGGVPAVWDLCITVAYAMRGATMRLLSPPTPLPVVATDSKSSVSRS